MRTKFVIFAIGAKIKGNQLQSQENLLTNQMFKCKYKQTTSCSVPCTREKQKKQKVKRKTKL